MAELNISLSEGPRLYNCFFDRKDSEEIKRNSTSIPCQYTVKINLERNDGEVWVQLAVKCDSEALPFSFDVGAEGKFTCDGQCSTEPEIIAVAIPYLFPFLKDFVADITRKGNFPPFYIPVIKAKTEDFELAMASLEKPTTPPPVKAKRKKTKKVPDTA